MNNTFLLIKSNIINSWGINKVLKSKSTGEKVKAGLMGLVIIYAICAVTFTMFLLSYQLGNILEKMNLLELLISSSILQTTLFALFMSVYKIPGYLYTFKDYDMLMALPLKPSAILTSKMIFVYLSNLGVAIVVGIPPLVVYGLKTSAGLLYYIFVAISSFFIPLIPIAIGAVFAYFLGRISSKFRSTNVFLLVGSLVLFLAIMGGSTMVSRVDANLVQNSIPTVTTINDILFWTKIYITALKDTDIISLLTFVVISILIFAIFIVVFSAGFKSINSKMSEKFKASNYKMTTLTVSSPLKAIYMKELKFYFSSYIYVMNTGFGIIMMTIFSFATAVFGKETVSKVLEIPMIDAYLPLMIILIFVFCINFTFTTAASISLEGKNLWIVKSLPISEESILLSKILVNLTLTIPALIINTSVISFALKFNAATVLAVFSVSLMYCFLQPIIGILLNLFFPKLEWTTHVAVVKQSASSLLATLFGFITIAVPAIIFILLKPTNINIFLWAVFAGIIIITLLLVKVLKTAGVKMFRGL